MREYWESVSSGVVELTEKVKELSERQEQLSKDVKELQVTTDEWSKKMPVMLGGLFNGTSAAAVKRLKKVITSESQAVKASVAASVKEGLSSHTFIPPTDPPSPAKSEMDEADEKLMKQLSLVCSFLGVGAGFPRTELTGLEEVVKRMAGEGTIYQEVRTANQSIARVVELFNRAQMHGVAGSGSSSGPGGEPNSGLGLPSFF